MKKYTVRIAYGLGKILFTEVDEEELLSVVSQAIELSPTRECVVTLEECNQLQ